MNHQELVVLLIALWSVLAAARLFGRRLLPLRWRVCTTCGREADACVCR
jgi:hypothetical protein